MSFCLWNHFGCVCEWSHTALQASCSQSGSHKMNLRSQDKVEINKAQHLLCIYLFVWTFILFLWWNTAQNIHYCHMQSCVIQRSEMYYMDLILPWGAVENQHLGTSSSSSSSSSRGGRTGELNLFMFYLKQSQKEISFSIHRLTTAICDEEAKDILILETLITKFAMITIHSQKVDCGEYWLLINNILKWMTRKRCQSSSQTALYFFPYLFWIA